MQNLNWIIRLFGISLSIFLVTQKVISGINLSLADVFLLPLILSLIFVKKFSMNKKTLITFMFFSVWTLCVSFIISSEINGYILQAEAILTDYLKLLVCFLYLCVGMTFVMLNIWEWFLKYYAAASAAASLLGILIVTGIFNFINLGGFYTGNRYQGFTDDPNLYAIMQGVGLSYYLFNENLGKTIKYIGTALISLGIIISGSKTGIVILISLFLCKDLLGHINYSKSFSISLHKFRKKLMASFLLIFILLFAVFMDDYIREEIPATDRIYKLFENYNEGIAADGSSREIVWYNATAVINDNMIFGTGTGAYLSVSEHLTGFRSVAHNTYLQIFAEWGLPLGLVFFSYIIFAFIRYFLIKGKKDPYILPVMIVMLIGSIGISLNNNRIFWLVLGALLAFIIREEKGVNTNDSCKK